MLYHLIQFADRFSPLRVFQYVTFRAAGAAMFAFLICLVFGPMTVRLLKRFQMAEASDDQRIPENTRDPGKRHVPSMGGLLVVFGIAATTLLWARLTSPLVLVFIGVLLSMAAVGFTDDYLKVVRGNKHGLPGRWKLVCQIVISAAFVLLLDALPQTAGYMRTLMLPFFKAPVVEHLPLFVAVGFGTLVVVAASNAVNLSDGMDGLAIGCTVVCAMTYAVFAYVSGHTVLAKYLLVPYLEGSSEVVVFASAIAGAGLGFLWHNCHPAAMFMGDTGSLSLGAAIGLIAVLVRQEIVLLLVGGIFVIEAGSVILQVTYFRLTRQRYGEGRRIFACAPFHHHLHAKGWTETQIVARFWILAVVLAAMGLATLKIR